MEKGMYLYAYLYKYTIIISNVIVIICVKTETLWIDLKFNCEKSLFELFVQHLAFQHSDIHTKLHQKTK